MHTLCLLCVAFLMFLTQAIAEYGSFCNKSTMCHGDAPFCNIFFVDTSYTNNMVSDISILPSEDIKPRVYGICVECLSDCDCGVNQYCGTDQQNPVRIPPFASENQGTGSNTFIKTRILAVSSSLSNLTIQSKCMDYVVPSSRCFLHTEIFNGYDYITEDQIPNIFFTSTVPQYNAFLAQLINTLRTPSGWPKEAESQFCGKINSFGPAFYSVVASGNQVDSVLEANSLNHASSAALSTAAQFYDFFNSPAVCPPWTIFKDNSVTCKSCLYGQNCELSSMQQRYCCSQPSGFNTQNRSCGSLNAYRSCRDACSGQLGTASTSDIVCNAALPASKYLTPAEVASYCACVSTCEACVSRTGGCGAQRAGSQLPPSVWGTCSGPCPAEPVSSTPVASQPSVPACNGSGAVVRVTSPNGKIGFESSYGVNTCTWIIAPTGAGAVSLSIEAANFYDSDLQVLICYDATCETTDTVATVSAATSLPVTISSWTGVVMLSFQDYSDPAYSYGSSFAAGFLGAAGVDNRITTCLAAAQPSAQSSKPPPTDMLTCQPECLACLAEAAGCACPDVVPNFTFTPACSWSGSISVASSGDGYSLSITSDPIDWVGTCERGTVE